MKEFRNEAEFSLYGGCECSLGLTQCNCVQACRIPERTKSEPPLTWGDAAIASFIVAAIVGFVFLGPMVRGVVHAWLT